MSKPGLFIVLIALTLGLFDIPGSEAAQLRHDFDSSVGQPLRVGVAYDAATNTFSATSFSSPDLVAQGTFVDGINSPSNMGHLEVRTVPKVPDEIQMTAAGYAEGYLTAERIHQHWSNMWTFFNLSSLPDNLSPLTFLSQQKTWVQDQIEQHKQADSHQGNNATEAGYWTTVGLVMAQFKGLHMGYNARAAEMRTAAAHQGRFSRTNHAMSQQTITTLPDLSEAQLYFLTSNADLSDIRQALQWQQQQQQQQAGSNAAPGADFWDGLSPGELEVELAVGGRCSALIKVAPDFSDLWVGQVAWYTYAAMLRLFKHYDFAVQHPGFHGRRLGFSSYYGALSSDDDFYLVNGDNSLVVLQTTNTIFDQQLLAAVQPQSVLCWQRVRAACAGARTGKEWAAIVAMYNSGTYTNSWMVLDNNLFNPGQALTPGLLTLVEQAPGHMFSADVTDRLSDGYFSLYNVPQLPEAYKTLGYKQFYDHMASRGPSYAAAAAGSLAQTAPRALIFRRDHSKVTDLETMKNLMRQNNWKDDPFSRNMSTNAICGRGDINPVHPRAAGCYDGKVSSLTMAQRLEAHVINGPPNTPDMPPFQWGEPWASQLSHLGQPAKFNFQWQHVKPEL